MIKLIQNNNILKFYQNFVKSHPLVGISLTSAVGMGTGNIICQSMMYSKKKQFNWYNLFQYASYGLIFSVSYLSNNIFF